MCIERIKTVGLGPVLGPEEHDLSTADKVHRKDYLDFLPTIWSRWTAEGRTGTALPFTWPTRGLRGDAPPEFIDGLLGYYSFDAGCGVVEGTWDAIKSSHDVALTAAGLVNAGERSAFALCRPPGHHAGAGFMGGYCYINNAAVAAQWFLDNGARRVSILDVDYHHGNGTQEIFYSRADVQVINLHADPMQEYPYFLGHADERGAGEGEGFNLNYPMRFGTSWETWSAVAGRRLRQASCLPAGCRRRLARCRYLREGPDQPVQAEDRRLSEDRRAHRKTRPADAFRHGRRLCRRRNRRQCRRAF